jgi:hypothetical protein
MGDAEGDGAKNRGEEAIRQAQGIQKNSVNIGDQNEK